MPNNTVKLSEHINVLSDFQYSINIEYDLYSDAKIKNYIPTTSAIDIIEDVMLSTSPKSKDRARIFVGAYGKGKSHLALMLIALLCRKEKDLYNNLLTMICETKPELCKYILTYQESSQKLLPVVIQGSSSGIRQSFLLALKKALQENGMSKIMPNTYFSAAISAINNWKENYKETYSAFKKSIHCSTTEFISELGQFNNAFYEEFVGIYPSLTSGSEFNPVNGMNIIDLYNDVNEKIREFGYTGIFVVYDEFSKFLSGNLKKTSSDEIEVLQYFAENCNRSGNKQMHIMLISHQSILNYVDKLPKSKIDSWKAVSNRYKSIELNTSASQTYEITARVIKKDEEWFKDYMEMHRNRFSQLYKWHNKRAFGELTENEFNRVIWGCYPLEPISTFLLPKISEKIAQNERTLFTFLSSEGQKHTLPEFIKGAYDSEFSLLTPDVIFDYFEPLFKAEAYDRPIHKLWKTASVALSKLSKKKSLEAKIVKTIALIYILDRIDILAPDIDTVLSIYSPINDMQDIITALTTLTNNGIVRKLDNKNHLRICEHTEQNIDALINDKIENKLLTTDVQSILNRFVGQKVLYPNAYNDDNEIVRYFDFKFLTSSELLSDESFVCEISDSAAGIVYAVVTEVDKYDATIAAIKAISDERVVFVVLKENDDIVRCAYKYDAIIDLIENSDDEILKEELSHSLLDSKETLQQYMDSFLCPELGESIYYVSGEKVPIHRRSSLSRKLSDICENVFSACPIINNEVINKDVITGQATNSRAKLIDGILANELKPNLGLVGSGQDVSFMRSTLKVTGIYLEDDEGVALSINNLPDRHLENVLFAIKEFIINTSQNGKNSFSNIYDYLTNPQYHIGMKKGVIPIYIAVVLHFYKKYVVIMKNNREMEINARLLEAINNAPKEYDLYLEQWDSDKENYIQILEDTFKAYIRVTEKEYNNFEYIVHALQRWYLQLPKYVKEIRNIYLGKGNSEPIDVTVVKFLNSLRSPELNARDYLFNKILWVLDSKTFDSGIALRVKELKVYIDNIKNCLIETLSEDLKNIFGKSNVSDGASLSSIVTDWTSMLDDNVKSHMFSNSDDLMLRICCEVTPNSDKFIEDLARPATGLRIDDWGEVTIDGFIRSISNFVTTVESYNQKIKQSENQTAAGSYKISFIDDSGIETFKTFDKTELPENAQLLYNDLEAMLTEEYGASLSDNEKRQVLIDIIGKLLS